MKLTAYEPQGDKDPWAERDAQGVALLCSYMAGDVCESSPCFNLFKSSREWREGLEFIIMSYPEQTTVLPAHSRKQALQWRPSHQKERKTRHLGIISNPRTRLRWGQDGDRQVCWALPQPLHLRTGQLLSQADPSLICLVSQAEVFLGNSLELG